MALRQAQGTGMENGPSTSSGYWNGEMENGEWRMENGEIRN